MLSVLEKKFVYIFVFILILERITDRFATIDFLYYIAKPAILISLILFFWYNSSHLKINTRHLTLLALTCSLIGDILLMFDENSSFFFIAGLVAFLIAHLLYIKIFYNIRDRTKNPFLIIAILLVYGIGLFYVLIDGLNDMLIPVIVYMLVILTMATTAFLRKNEANTSSFNLILFGAILFMISDSLLALNKFYLPFEFASLSIMSTYAFAQLFIVLGIKKQQ